MASGRKVGCAPHTDSGIVVCAAPPAGGARPRCTGVTLTEVVVASALLAVALVPLLKALTLTQVQDRALERKSWSLLLAQEELEWIRARCLGHYETCYRVSSKVLRDGYLGTVTDDGHPRLRTVTVSVGLDQDGDGVLSADEVEVHLTTRLARP